MELRHPPALTKAQRIFFLSPGRRAARQPGPARVRAVGRGGGRRRGVRGRRPAGGSVRLPRLHPPPRAALRGAPGGRGRPAGRGAAGELLQADEGAGVFGDPAGPARRARAQGARPAPPPRLPQGEAAAAVTGVTLPSLGLRAPTGRASPPWGGFRLHPGAHPNTGPTSWGSAWSKGRDPLSAPNDGSQGSEVAGSGWHPAHKVLLPCHSWLIPRMSRAQSNSTEPAGNKARSAKKLDSTFSTARGCTCQVKVRSSRPSNSPGLLVSEYPSDPRAKKADASSSDPNTEVEGSAWAT